MLPLLLLGSAAALTHAYSLSDAGGLGARYLGIGGLSGGGATSRLLPDYSNAIRSEIFDWLFKPSFGASLQILKVEVGGGGQSTEGTEASHQYTANASEASFQRGYEWLVMREALARNPNMSIWALSWAWPAWVGCPGGDLASPACDKSTPYTFPEQTAAYTTAFVQGAAREHNISIATVGSWNERGYSKDYILALRAALTGAGFADTKIVCDDFNWKCGTDMLADPALLAAVDYVSGHNDQPPALAQLKGARPTVDSEGYHTTGSDAGAASWIRELNTRYIEFNQSANIAWNLVTAYYEGIRRHCLLAARADARLPALGRVVHCARQHLGHGALHAVHLPGAALALRHGGRGRRQRLPRRGGLLRGAHGRRLGALEPGAGEDARGR